MAEAEFKSLIITGVSWFEVDRSDVLRAKHKALKKAGAAFSQSDNQIGTTFSVSVHSLTIAMLQLGAACLPAQLMGACSADWGCCLLSHTWSAWGLPHVQAQSTR